MLNKQKLFFTYNIATNGSVSESIQTTEIEIK